MKQVAMTFVVLYLYMKIHILFIPVFFLLFRVFVAIVATDNKLCKLWLKNQKANNKISEISSNINEKKEVK